MTRKNMIPSSIVTIIPIFIGLVIWNSLPDTMAVHFDLNGVPNGYASKAMVVFGMPIFLLAINLLLIFVTEREDKDKDISKKMLKVLIWICPFISCIVVGSIFLNALKYNVNIPMIAMFIIAILEIAIGNYLPKCRKNSVVGIRVPWTMECDTNWNRTHRFAGNIYFFSGVITFILIFFTEYFGVVLFLNLIAVLSPIFYSFLIRNK